MKPAAFPADGLRIVKPSAQPGAYICEHDNKCGAEKGCGSDEAPEALFHLGAVYDYPNISSFAAAIRYYRGAVRRLRRVIRHAAPITRCLDEARHAPGEPRGGSSPKEPLQMRLLR